MGSFLRANRQGLLNTRLFSSHLIDDICYESERLFAIVRVGKKNALLRWESVDNTACLRRKSGRRNTKCGGDYSPPPTVQCQLVILGCIIRISSLHLPSFKCTDYHAKAQWRVWERDGIRSEGWLHTSRKNTPSICCNTAVKATLHSKGKKKKTFLM